MLSDAFDQKQFEGDLGAAIDAFNEGRSGTFEASSSYDEKAGKFTIEKARSNEKLNREHVIKYTEIELASLAETVDLTKLGNDAYEPLNGTLTNDQIQAACDAANNFLCVNVTLKLNGEDAAKLVANGCKCVVEGANMPSTPEAIAVFQKAKLLYSPGKASNAGGVATSGLEMTQNSIRLKWSAEEDEKLHAIMHGIHAQCVKYGTEPDGYINYVKGANIAGFMTVADAMLAQGIV